MEIVIDRSRYTIVVRTLAGNITDQPGEIRLSGKDIVRAVLSPYHYPIATLHSDGYLNANDGTDDYVVDYVVLFAESGGPMPTPEMQKVYRKRRKAAEARLRKAFGSYTVTDTVSEPYDEDDMDACARFWSEQADAVGRLAELAGSFDKAEVII